MNINEVLNESENMRRIAYLIYFIRQKDEMNTLSSVSDYVIYKEICKLENLKAVDEYYFWMVFPAVIPVWITYERGLKMEREQNEKRAMIRKNEKQLMNSFKEYKNKVQKHRNWGLK